MKLIPPNDPILWTPCEEVTDIKTQVIPHIEEMWRLMKVHKGIGLAAPQVGINLRFFILGKISHAGKYLGFDVIINPKVREQSAGMEIGEEGCLSLPNYKKDVVRPDWIEAEWTDWEETSILIKLNSYDSRVFLHELDHLDGKCIFPRP